MLDLLLDRLANENLHGPTSPYNPPTGQNARSGARPRSGAEEDSWILVKDEMEDLDSKDPRWLELFIEFFLEMETTANDDLLFFVRLQDPQHPPEADQDPIFVKRKVDKTMPALNEMIDWKQTLFLNLIIQLPCTLTVAVCRRSSANSEKKKSLLNRTSNERVVVVGGGGGGAGVEEGTELQSAGKAHSIAQASISSGLAAPANGDDSPYASNASLGGAPRNSTSSTPASPKPAQRSKMVALRRITKKVYAAPYKSRMDIKDAFMNECSYPLVYYTVNDYESFDLHLEIREREYLCVELSIMIPKTESKRDLADELASISLDEDSTPFPVPADCHKVILFQGAVPFSSLLDIYQQKGLAAQNQRSSWGKLPSGNGGGNGRGRDSKDDKMFGDRTEYIMMRGPHGKGQCQVSIREYLQNQESQDEATSPTAGSTPKASSTILKFLGSTVRAGISAVAGTTGNPQQQHQQNASMKKPETLVCSMTYVNVPWQSIIRTATTFNAILSSSTNMREPKDRDLAYLATTVSEHSKRTVIKAIEPWLGNFRQWTEILTDHFPDLQTYMTDDHKTTVDDMAKSLFLSTFPYLDIFAIKHPKQEGRMVIALPEMLEFKFVLKVWRMIHGNEFGSKVASYGLPENWVAGPKEREENDRLSRSRPQPQSLGRAASVDRRGGRQRSLSVMSRFSTVDDGDMVEDVVSTGPAGTTLVRAAERFRETAEAMASQNAVATRSVVDTMIPWWDLVAPAIGKEGMGMEVLDIGREGRGELDRQELAKLAKECKGRVRADGQLCIPTEKAAAFLEKVRRRIDDDLLFGFQFKLPTVNKRTREDEDGGDLDRGRSATRQRTGRDRSHSRSIATEAHVDDDEGERRGRRRTPSRAPSVNRGRSRSASKARSTIPIESLEGTGLEAVNPARVCASCGIDKAPNFQKTKNGGALVCTQCFLKGAGPAASRDLGKQNLSWQTYDPAKPFLSSSSRQAVVPLPRRT
ncbi:hypothetical protein HDU97_007350 [Phlyctochytrium planicorne]|nr:hypothetical protein HDU97_007350 [Phlyctochytrium planicorne]